MKKFTIFIPGNFKYKSVNLFFAKSFQRFGVYIGQQAQLKFLN